MRQVSDWVSIGLLDLGTDRGRGQGKGKVYRWSEHQRRLFLTLLGKRDEASRPTLLNVPVTLWLVCGDEYVPLRQARRALASWTGSHIATSAQKARLTARQILRELDHPGAPRGARKELRQYVESAAAGHRFDEGHLLTLARAVHNPNGDRPQVPPTAMTPETYVTVLTARLEAARLLAADRNASSIPDQVFLIARQRYQVLGPPARRAAAPLSREHQLLAPELLSFEQPTNTACLHLLTLIGLTLQNDR